MHSGLFKAAGYARRPGVAPWDNGCAVARNEFGALLGRWGLEVHASYIPSGARLCWREGGQLERAGQGRSSHARGDGRARVRSLAVLQGSEKECRGGALLMCASFVMPPMIDLLCDTNLSHVGGRNRSGVVDGRSITNNASACPNEPCTTHGTGSCRELQ
jgi:hypothetical protein